VLVTITIRSGNTSVPPKHLEWLLANGFVTNHQQAVWDLDHHPAAGSSRLPRWPAVIAAVDQYFTRAGGAHSFVKYTRFDIWKLVAVLSGAR
jgi:hypothetical protein